MDRKYPELNALKGLMREKKKSYRELAKIIGISLNSLNAKVNGYYPLTIAEAVQLAEVLEIDPREISRYFMPDYFKTYKNGFN